MEPEPTRPVDAADLDRLYAVLTALEIAVVEPDAQPLWQALQDIHAGMDRAPSESPTVDLDDLIGDEAGNREIHHARIVVEALRRRGGRVPIRPTHAMYSPCSVPGCPELTHARLCPPPTSWRRWRVVAARDVDVLHRVRRANA